MIELIALFSNCYPIPEYKWFKDGKIFDQDESHLIQSDSFQQKLVLNKSNESDEGKYSLRSTNEFGTAETSCSGTVQGLFLTLKFSNIIQITIIKHSRIKISAQFGTSYKKEHFNSND